MADLTRKDLAERWIKTRGHPPPRGVKRGLLERDLAWRLQARAYGGLKAATRRTLLAIARGEDAVRPAKTTALKPGARLIRAWHGVTHQVDVTEDGFRWNGVLYTSLSAIARAITGARWSGPRFFGL